VLPKGANSMAASMLGCRNNLVGIRKAISVLFSVNVVGNKRSHLVRSLFPAFMPVFQPWQVGIS